MADRSQKLDHRSQAAPAPAAGALLPLVYDELKAIAKRQLRRAPAQTLQPTALVHEAYLKLADQTRAVWKDQEHFIAVAATMMRRVLIDHARHRKRLKRGGDRHRLELDALLDGAVAQAIDVESLHESLTRLEQRDRRKGRLVELRFFGGLTIEQAADLLGISVATAKREWQLARGWLYRDIHGERS